jgi:hypothetical protein
MARAKSRFEAPSAIFPDPFSRSRVSVAEAERLIRHYRLSTHDEAGVVDLMLAMVEADAEQSLDLGYASDKYFASLERVLVKALPRLQATTRPSMVRRRRELAERASPLAWGYGDAVRQITAAATSPPKKRGSSRRAPLVASEERSGLDDETVLNTKSDDHA